MFLVSITHNSKIRELSEENKKLKQSYGAPKWTSRYGSHHFWVMSYGNRELSYGNKSSKQPLNFTTLD